MKIISHPTFFLSGINCISLVILLFPRPTKTTQTWFDATLVLRFNECNREVIIHRPDVSTLLSSAFITPDEDTGQECRNVESMNCNFSVTFIKSLNQSSITPCLIVHLVALWTLICFKDNLLVESRRSESVYSRFVSTINAFNGMLSRFIFFIDLIDSDHELKLISINQSINQLTTSFKCLSLLARRQK